MLNPAVLINPLLLSLLGLVWGLVVCSVPHLCQPVHPHLSYLTQKDAKIVAPAAMTQPSGGRQNLQILPSIKLRLLLNLHDCHSPSSKAVSRPPTQASQLVQSDLDSKEAREWRAGCTLQLRPAMLSDMPQRNQSSLRAFGQQRVVMCMHFRTCLGLHLQHCYGEDLTLPSA